MGKYRTEREYQNKLLISKTILLLLSANVIVMTPMQSINTDNGETFDNAINLSNAMGRSEDSNIAASGDNVYVTWWDNKTGTREVYFRASTDNGETFGNKKSTNSSSIISSYFM